MVLQPASMTPEPINRCCAWNCGQCLLYALPKDRRNILLPVKHGYDFDRDRLRPVDDCVVRITGKGPETKGAGREVATRMAAHGAVG